MTTCKTCKGSGICVTCDGDTPNHCIAGCDNGKCSNCSDRGLLYTNPLLNLVQLHDWLCEKKGERYLDKFHISFKTKDKYLTTEGWPLGTECWYVFVQTAGRRVFICRSTLNEALHIAVIRLTRYLSGDDTWTDGINAVG